MATIIKTGKKRSVVQVGTLRIDRNRFEVRICDHEVRLSRKEFELLWALVSDDGRAFRREDLVDRVWGRSHSIAPRTVDVHIARIRTKLRDILATSPMIDTAWGIGYRLKVPVRS